MSEFDRPLVETFFATYKFPGGGTTDWNLYGKLAELPASASITEFGFDEDTTGAYNAFIGDPRNRMKALQRETLTRSYDNYASDIQGIHETIAQNLNSDTGFLPNNGRFTSNEPITESGYPDGFVFLHVIKPSETYSAYIFGPKVPGDEAAHSINSLVEGLLRAKGLVGALELYAYSLADRALVIETPEGNSFQEFGKHEDDDESEDSNPLDSYIHESFLGRMMLLMKEYAQNGIEMEFELKNFYFDHGNVHFRNYSSSFETDHEAQFHQVMGFIDMVRRLDVENIDTLLMNAAESLGRESTLGKKPDLSKTDIARIRRQLGIRRETN